jgi:Zn-dependent M16 (insulinase) family peptidase
MPYHRLLLCALLLSCSKPTVQNPSPKKTTAPTSMTTVNPPQKKEEVPLSLNTLQEGQQFQNFQAVALYLNDADQPIGARFLHLPTGFTLDLLQIQSVPQAFIWVNSFPTSDKGEPHTQEHLLLGKGNVGRNLASLEEMSLTESSAFTQQWRTAYHFQTNAGGPVFYENVEHHLDALLHPDYTDEEIRREVCNWGLVEDPATKALRLEEAGTVYQEMLSSSAGADDLLFRRVSQTLYGEEHPLSYSSGGWPSALRTLKPEDIRKFHKANYHLGNMGMVASLPKEQSPSDALKQFDAIFARLEPTPPQMKFMKPSDLPAPKASPAGLVQLVDYPDENEQKPSAVLFAWPATLSLTPKDRILLELFLESFVGDATTNLYKTFIDSETRVIQTGAKSVYSYLDSEMILGNPIYIGLEDVEPAYLTEAKVKEIRSLIQKELSHLAELPDKDPALLAFNARIKSRAVETKRGLAKFIDSPPGFGFRNTGSGWMTHLDAINQTPGFRKSVTQKDDLNEILKRLEGDKNIWREQLASWGLLKVEPYAIAMHASAKLLKQNEDDTTQRATAELARLKTKYALSDDQAALQKYNTEYDNATLALEKEAKASTATRFVENPPLTLDDQLTYEVKKINNIEMVASTFDSMSSATTGIALGLTGIRDNQLIYASMLPGMLTRVGVIENGKAVSYEEMSERQRREILSLYASFSGDYRTGRVELVLRGAGNDIEESKRSLDWMSLVLHSPDWRPENLPRIRDVVDQALSNLRNRTEGPEESWVNDPADAYRSQTNPVMLSTLSFLTRAHHVYRLRWQLKDPGKDSDALTKYLNALATSGSKASRADLKALLAAMKDGTSKPPKSLSASFDSFQKLSTSGQGLMKEAATDLDLLLADIPNATLSSDWLYLVRQLRDDLMMSPEDVLERFTALRQTLLNKNNARLFQIGSRASQEALAPKVATLISGLSSSLCPADDPLCDPHQEKTYEDPIRIIDARLSSRVKGTPLFVGFLSPNTQGGIFLNSVPSASYFDIERDAQLNYLASCLYAGHGAHGIFIKTWGAGLAYSNGMRNSVREGLAAYYAERTPELPQTLRFVIDTLQSATPTADIAEYAFAIAFSELHGAASYEYRGEQMATDLADGVTPEVVTKFRKALLSLRKDPELLKELSQRKDAVYAKLLPGYSSKVRAKDVSDAVYYVIGSEKQLSAYEGYLKTVEGKDASLVRLYPRDYWITGTPKK